MQLLITFFPPQKRQLAAQSLAFNLKDKVFCELFPEVVEVREVMCAMICFSVFPLLCVDLYTNCLGLFPDNGYFCQS